MLLDVLERSRCRQFNYTPRTRGDKKSLGARCQQESVDQIALVDFDFVRSQQVLIIEALLNAV